MKQNLSNRLPREFKFVAPDTYQGVQESLCFLFCQIVCGWKGRPTDVYLQNVGRSSDSLYHGYIYLVQFQQENKTKYKIGKTRHVVGLAVPRLQAYVPDQGRLIYLHQVSYKRCHGIEQRIKACLANRFARVPGKQEYFYASLDDVYTFVQVVNQVIYDNVKESKATRQVVSQVTNSCVQAKKNFSVFDNRPKNPSNLNRFLVNQSISTQRQEGSLSLPPLAYKTSYEMCITQGIAGAFTGTIRDSLYKFLSSDNRSVIAINQVDLVKQLMRHGLDKGDTTLYTWNDYTRDFIVRNFENKGVHYSMYDTAGRETYTIQREMVLRHFRVNPYLCHTQDRKKL